MIKKLFLFQLKPLLSFLPLLFGSLFVHQGIIDGTAGFHYYNIHPLAYVLSFLLGMAGVAVNFRHFTQLGVSRRDFYLSLLARQLVFALVYFLILASLVSWVDSLYPSNHEIVLFGAGENLSGMELFKGYVSIFLAHLIWGLLGVHVALIFNKLNANGRGLALVLMGGAIFLLSVLGDMSISQPFLVYVLETGLSLTQAGLLVVLTALLWLSLRYHNSQDYFR